MSDAAVRGLGPGDEVVAAEAVLRFKGRRGADTAGFLADPRSVMMVAHDGADLVGWAYGHELLRPEGRTAMLLYEVDVVPAARRRGLGRRLVEAVRDEARRRGCIEMWVLTEQGNLAAAALYRAAGGVPDRALQTMYGWEFIAGGPA